MGDRKMKFTEGMEISFDDIEECLAKKAECLGLKYGKIVNKTENSGLPLEKKELLVYSCLGLEPKNIDEILREIPLTFVEISNIITNLQINGYVEEMIEGQKVIKVFCHEKESKKNFYILNI